MAEGLRTKVNDDKWQNIKLWEEKRDTLGVKVRSNDLEEGSDRMLIKCVGHTKMGGAANNTKDREQIITASWPRSI